MRLAVLALLLAFGVGCAPDTATKPKRVDIAPVHACGDELTLTGRVVDPAHVLPNVTVSNLDRQLAAYERRTRHQFVVVIAPSLGGSDIDLYSIRLFRRWGIGRRGVNDGIGLLIAPNERKARIEVGLGLERALPDDVAASVLREVFPRFRAGHIAGGTDAGVTAIIAAMDHAEARQALDAH